MTKTKRRKLALFYCRNVPGSGETDRQTLEKIWEETVSLFPMPCSGRVEPVHLLKGLEEFSDAAYVVACPEGACRNFEGNGRVKKRIERCKTLLKEIGLEPERVGLVVCSKQDPKPLADILRTIMEKTASLGPSPALPPMNSAVAASGPEANKEEKTE